MASPFYLIPLSFRRLDAHLQSQQGFRRLRTSCPTLCRLSCGENNSRLQGGWWSLLQPASLGLHQGGKERHLKPTWAGGVTISSEGFQDHCSRLTTSLSNPCLVLPPQEGSDARLPRGSLKLCWMKDAHFLCKRTAPFCPGAFHPCALHRSSQHCKRSHSMKAVILTWTVQEKI